MEKVKPLGQVVYEPLRDWMLLGVEYKDLRRQFQGALTSAAHAVLDADPVRTQALALVERIAALDPDRLDTGGLIADAREFVRKAREASKAETESPKS